MPRGDREFFGLSEESRYLIEVICQRADGQRRCTSEVECVSGFNQPVAVMAERGSLANLPAQLIETHVEGTPQGGEIEGWTLRHSASLSLRPAHSCRYVRLARALDTPQWGSMTEPGTPT